MVGVWMFDALKSLKSRYFGAIGGSDVVTDDVVKNKSNIHDVVDDLNFSSGYKGECMWKLHACHKLLSRLEVDYLSQVSVFNALDAACVEAELKRVDAPFPSKFESELIAERDIERIKKIGLEKLIKETRNQIDHFDSVVQADDRMVGLGDEIKNKFKAFNALKNEIKMLEIDLLFEIEMGDGDADGSKRKSITELNSDISRCEEALAGDIASYNECAAIIADSLLKDFISECRWVVAKILALYGHSSPVLRFEIDIMSVERVKELIDESAPDLSMALGVRGRLKSALCDLESEAGRLNLARISLDECNSEMEKVNLEIDRTKLSLFEHASKRSHLCEPTMDEVQDEIKSRRLKEAADVLNKRIGRLNIECSRYYSDVDKLNAACNSLLDDVIELDLVEYRKSRKNHYESIVAQHCDENSELDIDSEIKKSKSRIESLKGVNDNQLAILSKEESAIVALRASIRSLELLLKPSEACVANAISTNEDDIKNEIKLKARQAELCRVIAVKDKLCDDHIRTTNEIADSYNYYCNCLLLLAKRELDSFIAKNSETLARIVALSKKPDRLFIFETDGDLLLSAKHLLRREIPSLGFCVIGERPNLY